MVACGNPEEAKGQKMQFYTNQFKMKIGKNAPQIYQYSLKLVQGHDPKAPDVGNYEFSPQDMEKAVEGARKKLELVFGKGFIYSGYNLWCTAYIEDTHFFMSNLMRTPVTLIVDADGSHVVNTSDIDNPNRDDTQAMNQILNVIVKQAMGQTGLLQIGNRPRFYDSSSSRVIQELEMQMWSGFRAAAYKYASGCSLIIDTCSRFLSTKTVLDMINSIYDDHVHSDQVTADDIARFQDAVRSKFVSQSVIANYGNKRCHIVKDIVFSQGPCNTYFELKDKNGAKMNVAKYFYQTYKMKISDKRQPMIMVHMSGKPCYIPSEFCLVDGVPD